MNYVIARPIEGISLNGNEYLLDEDGNVLRFSDIESCKRFIEENITTENPEDYIWEEEDEKSN